MIIREATLGLTEVSFASYREEFFQIRHIAENLSADRILAINPRSGEMLSDLRARGAKIDSFVSDDEWVDAAKGFSENVHFGYSHAPLLRIPDETYDLVLVCEDFALVDDVDRMVQQYYRVLKCGGALLGGVWNMSWYGNIEALIAGRDLPDDFNEPIHGKYSIVIDTFKMRLERLGFELLDIFAYRSPGKAELLEQYAEISTSMEIPVGIDRFAAKIYFMKALKG
jgi:SAM-dependent methyltransferase